jgi:GntR family transcriptional regulator
VFEHIDPRSPTPLYAQIAERLRVAIAAGELHPGDPLPSVRQLAARIRVNPATAMQAYRELESAGFVELRQGAGTFVKAIAAERRAEERGAQARQMIRAMLAEAGRLGIPLSELRTALEHELGVAADD